MLGRSFCGLLAGLVLGAAVDAQPAGQVQAGMAESRSSASEVRFNEAASRIARNPKAAQALSQALLRGDRLSVASIFQENGAPLPPNAQVEMGPVLPTPHPADLCYKLTWVRVTVSGRSSQVPKIRFYDC
jgi:hypothetical protein